ncbi:MAG: hypothetical protein K2K97_01945 [Muribaculaceae bacterium]|nr:hypothetical protein [Muribaculaceae bacterium]
MRHFSAKALWLRAKAPARQALKMNELELEVSELEFEICELELEVSDLNWRFVSWNH